MARYISEEDFIQWVKEHYCTDCDNYNGVRCRACWIDDAIDLVEEAPTADVVPKSEVDKLRQRAFEQGKRDNVYGLTAEELAQKCDQLAVELEAMRGAANSYKMHYEKAQAEVERLKKENEKLTINMNAYGLAAKRLAEEKTEIFAELDKLKYRQWEDPYYYLDYDDVAELKKKYTEERV